MEPEVGRHRAAKQKCNAAPLVEIPHAACRRMSHPMSLKIVNGAGTEQLRMMSRSARKICVVLFVLIELAPAEVDWLHPNIILLQNGSWFPVTPCGPRPHSRRRSGPERHRLSAALRDAWWISARFPEDLRRWAAAASTLRREMEIAGRNHHRAHRRAARGIVASAALFL